MSLRSESAAVRSGAARASGAPASVRMDKWLWAARFFRTRALAARACELGRVLSQGMRAKPAREVHAGDQLRIENESGIFEVEVLELSEIRGPAATAQALYRESDASRAARMQAAEQRRAMQQMAPAPETRPSKRDRRRIVRFRESL
jgi:ribosome-associated heat shock protein Hsp15